jgi:hypothetical protein
MALSSELFETVERNDLAVVEELLSRTADITSIDALSPTGKTRAADCRQPGI